MIKIHDIYKFLESFAPLTLGESWDNNGLIIGDENGTVNKVICALDITDKTIDKAISIGANLIISHHPIIFKAQKTILKTDPLGSKIYSMIKNDISAICMHTNLDSTEGGINDVICDMLDITQISNMGAGESGMLGRIGHLPHEMYLKNFLPIVKDKLNINTLKYVDGGVKVNRVAVGSGSCGKLLSLVSHLGADTFITSDISHDIMVLASEIGINLIDAGHFYTEDVIIKRIIEMLKKEFINLEIHYSSEGCNPIEFM